MAMDANGLAKRAGRMQNESTTTEGATPRRVLPKSEVVTNLLMKYERQVRELFSDPKMANEFLRTVITTVAADPKLMTAVHECPESLIGAILLAASLKLQPNTPLGLCYLLPYSEKDKVRSQREGHDVKVMKVNLQLGYQGVLNLAYRSGEIAYVNAEAVYEKDTLDYRLGTEHYLTHIPYDGNNPGAVVRYYAVVTLKSGQSLFKVWSADKVMDHAVRFSKSYNSQYGKFYGPWDNNFDAMAKKTVLLDVLKLAPKSVTFSSQLGVDSSTKSVTAETSVADILNLRNEAFDNEPAQVEAQTTAALPSLPAPTGEEEEEEPPKDLETLKGELALKKGTDLKPPAKRRLPSVEELDMAVIS